MKNKILPVLIWICSTWSLQALDASISYATFKSEDAGYIEVYLHVVGSTIEFYSLPDSSMQAAAEVVIIFSRQGEVVKFDKYMLNSPRFSQPEDFLDVKRYALENGDYEIEVSIKDARQAGNARKYKQAFVINFDTVSVQQSDIQLLASLQKQDDPALSNPMVKNGYLFEPLPSHFFDKYCDRLIFYNEIYNTGSFLGDDFLLSFYLVKKEGTERSNPVMLSHKRRNPAAVVPFIHQMDIVNLESGNYDLVVEVKSKTGDLLSRKSVSFQRSNPYLNSSREEIASGTNSLDQEFVAKMNDQELRYSLKAIAMQVDKTDGELLNIIIKEGKPEAMKLYLFSYWANLNPVHPEEEYNAYMNVARKIDERYRNGFGYGFESDRGYVFMKYGMPSDIVSVETESSAPPYEIWFYNEFPQTGQNNVKFLFYNPSLAMNGHILLHSTARGEVNNPRWEVELYRNAPGELDGNNFIDGDRMQGNFNRNARRLFESY